MGSIRSPTRGEPAGAACPALRITQQGPARRGRRTKLAFGMDRAPGPLQEDQAQTRRDLRAAIIFGIVAAAIELGAILYFFW